MSYRTCLDHVLDYVDKHPERPFLYQPVNGEHEITTWHTFDQHARRIANGLQAQNIAPGSRIGILAKNCAEWFIVDIAITMAGYISVPIYPTANENTIRYVIEHSEMQALFVGKMDDTAEAEKAIPDSLLTIAFPYPTLETKTTWMQWLEQYKPLTDIHKPELDEVMTIVYTSGSTGVPKGVVLTHRNFAAAGKATAEKLGITPDDRCMSYLPLAHITERSVVEAVAFLSGVKVYFVESLDTFIEDVQYAEPTQFLSVPRLWLKFQSQILAKMPQEKLQRLLRIPLLGKFIAYKIRKALGVHKAPIFGSGSAPISIAVLEWFARIGINISEGWGMTETTGLACSNLPPDDVSRGTIGKPIASVEMKLSDEGEILIRGDGVFSEYYLNPEETAKSFEDGWFKTGDCAEITPSGDYKIVGRIKEQFKSGKGKYVAPVPIESLLYDNTAIDQVCVVGSGLKQPVALVVLAENCLPGDGALEQSLRDTLNQVNDKLEAHQKLDMLFICKDSWTTENGLLTPTLKVKRNVLEAKYQDLLEGIKPEPILWENALPENSVVD